MTMDKVLDLISNAKLSVGIANGQGLGALFLTLIFFLLIVCKRGRFFEKLLDAATSKAHPDRDRTSHPKPTPDEVQPGHK